MVETVEQSDELVQQFEKKYVDPVVSEEESTTIQENAAFDLNDREINVVYNARLRLEQARLYEMLINHDIFGGVDVNPEAINTVQNELKNFIVERLEILMGIRTEVNKIESSVLPFNEVEIDFLKQLAYKGTHGASISTPIVKSELKPITVKKQINVLKPLVKNIETPKLQSSTKNTIKQKSFVSTPKQKTSNVEVKNDDVRIRNLTQAEIDALAIEDLKKLDKRKKPFHKMNEQEKEEAIREVNSRHKAPKVSQALPMPTTEELEYKYLTEQSKRSGNKQLDELNQVITNVVLKNKNQNMESEVYND